MKVLLTETHREIAIGFLNLPLLIIITWNTLPVSTEAAEVLRWRCSSAICVCCCSWLSLRFCICVPWFCICVCCCSWLSLRFCICVPWFCICVCCCSWLSLRFCICVPWFCICVCCCSCALQRSPIHVFCRFSLKFKLFICLLSAPLFWSWLFFWFCICVCCSTTGNNGYSIFKCCNIQFALRKYNMHMLVYFDHMTDEHTPKRWKY